MDDINDNDSLFSPTFVSKMISSNFENLYKANLKEINLNEKQVLQHNNNKYTINDIIDSTTKNNDENKQLSASFDPFKDVIMNITKTTKLKEIFDKNEHEYMIYLIDVKNNDSINILFRYPDTTQNVYQYKIKQFMSNQQYLNDIDNGDVNLIKIWNGIKYNISSCDIVLNSIKLVMIQKMYESHNNEISTFLEIIKQYFIDKFKQKLVLKPRPPTYPKHNQCNNLRVRL